MPGPICAIATAGTRRAVTASRLNALALFIPHSLLGCLRSWKTKRETSFRRDSKSQGGVPRSDRWKEGSMFLSRARSNTNRASRTSPTCARLMFGLSELATAPPPSPQKRSCARAAGAIACAPARRLGHLLVTAGFAVRNGEERAPHLPLEQRPRVNQRHREAGEAPREILFQLALESLQMRIRAWKDRLVEAALHRFELGLEHAPVGELQQTHAFVRSAGHQRAERTANPREPHVVACAVPRSLSEGAREGVVESAVRIIAAVEDDGAQVGALADLLQGAGQAPRACVGLERHSILLEKI